MAISTGDRKLSNLLCSFVNIACAGAAHRAQGSSGAAGNVNEPIELSERQQAILRLVEQEGFQAIEALAQAFHMTPQTIRRDINEMCALGLLRRYHGGAGLPSSVENTAYSDRQVLCLDEKRRIAALAAAHVPDHASVFINIGTTTEEVARALAERAGLRVITNNLNVAWLLRGRANVEVIIAGGVVRRRDGGITSEATIDFIREFKVDIGIIGISGVDADGSLLDFDYHEVRVSQAIVENSRRVFLVADHSKFGRNALVRLGPLSIVDDLYTDVEPPAAFARLAAEQGVHLHVAAPAPGTSADTHAGGPLEAR